MTEGVADIAIVGAGAAGLMAAIWAGRAAREAGAANRIVLLDGAQRLGAKILVAGGGRCNVTHDVVDASAYAGSSPNAIRRVLRRFDVPRTVAFFREIGVELKREETGKLFPTTDNARTVLEALLRAARDAGIRVVHPWRVRLIQRVEVGFLISAEASVRPITARRIILATGGKSLPKSGSDGAGYGLARELGHSITPRILPALVPLTLPKDHPLCALSGVSALATLQVRSATNRVLKSFTDSTLCAHFGLSGPAVLDVSRYLTDARLDDPGARLVVNWLPSLSTEALDRMLIDLGKISPGRFLRERGLPARLAETLCALVGVDPSSPANQLTREQRRALARGVTNLTVPVTGDRGFAHAEVTAGGVPLSEVKLETMESRVCPGLHIIGEICDVDGRIGGYNFQWAWASGYVAGFSAGTAVAWFIAQAPAFVRVLPQVPQPSSTPRHESDRPRRCTDQPP
jgi:predicted Rossmann fold flavoprotein